MRPPTSAEEMRSLAEGTVSNCGMDSAFTVRVLALYATTLDGFIALSKILTALCRTMDLGPKIAIDNIVEAVVYVRQFT